MKFLALCVLFPALLSGGCTSRTLQYDRSRAPLEQQTRVQITRDFMGGYGQPRKLTLGELADDADVPQEGTIELSNSPFARDQSESDACDDSFVAAAQCMFCYLACPPLALGAALVYLPYLAATGQMHGDRQGEAPSPRQQQAKWLASVVEDAQWSAVLDDAYILGLNQALGWASAAVEGEEERVIPQQDPDRFLQPQGIHFNAGISRIVVLDSKSGERTLLLCARSTIHLHEASGPRRFETCQRGRFDVRLMENVSASEDALKTLLLEQARQLAIAQAAELCPTCIGRQ